MSHNETNFKTMDSFSDETRNAINTAAQSMKEEASKNVFERLSKQNKLKTNFTPKVYNDQINAHGTGFGQLKPSPKSTKRIPKFSNPAYAGSPRNHPMIKPSSPTNNRIRMTGSPSSQRSFSYSPSGNKIYHGRDYYENKYNQIQCFIEVKPEDI